MRQRYHRNPVASVERQLSNGSWKLITCEPYNYFIDSGGIGPGPYTLRVTDIYGNSIIDSGIVLTVGAETAGKEQFPVMP